MHRGNRFSTLFSKVFGSSTKRWHGTCPITKDAVNSAKTIYHEATDRVDIIGADGSKANLSPAETFVMCEGILTSAGYGVTQPQQIAV